MKHGTISSDDLVGDQRDQWLNWMMENGIIFKTEDIVKFTVTKTRNEDMPYKVDLIRQVNIPSALTKTPLVG